MAAGKVVELGTAFAVAGMASVVEVGMASVAEEGKP